MTQAACQSDRRRLGRSQPLRVNQPMSMFRRASKRDRPLHTRRAPAAAARRHPPRDGEEALSVGQFQPLRDYLAGPLEHMMDRPERA